MGGVRIGLPQCHPQVDRQLLMGVAPTLVLCGLEELTFHIPYQYHSSNDSGSPFGMGPQC